MYGKTTSEMRSFFLSPVYPSVPLSREKQLTRRRAKMSDVKTVRKMPDAKKWHTLQRKWCGKRRLMGKAVWSWHGKKAQWRENDAERRCFSKKRRAKSFPIGRIPCCVRRTDQVLPVEPKPLVPRSVSESSSERTNSARRYGIRIICATRSPPARVTGSFPWLWSGTMNSPR